MIISRFLIEKCHNKAVRNCLLPVLLLLAFSACQRADTEYPLPMKLEELDGKRIGVFSGTVHDAFVAENYPRARIYRFSSYADMIIALKIKRIDAVMFDLVAARMAMRQYPELGLLSEDILDLPLGVGFHKQQESLLWQFNAWLAGIRESGLYDEIHDRWFLHDPEETDMPAIEKRGEQGRLRLGITLLDPPYVFQRGGEHMGFDIEIMRRFASDHGYELEFVVMDFSALVPALAAGRVDMIASCIAITEERARQVNFSQPHAWFKTAILVNKDQLAGSEYQVYQPGQESILSRLSEGFSRNLLHEKRYKLILSGLYVTLLITLLAAMAGTVAGGLICRWRMSSVPWLWRSAAAFISLIRGIPVLVLLMIAYYIVFASVTINPLLVAVMAFGLNFAAYVSEMFRTAIESIDKGQMEAGIASGFSPLQAFIHIVAPQAIRRVMPVYKGELVSLLKMTSVVGYIAVQDLTKASDIIRARTFDAFFPLILAAVIYLLIAWALIYLLDRMEIGFDAQHRIAALRKKAGL